MCQCQTLPDTPLLRLAGLDDVAVALRDIAEGEKVSVGDVVVHAKTSIPKGHKMALGAVPAGSPVRKYGFTIGVALRPIEAGEHVHTHNLTAGPRPGAQFSQVSQQRQLPDFDLTAFRGYRRHGRRAGTRNHVVVVATTNCSADVVQAIAFQARRELLQDFPYVDDIIPITHASGCGLPLEGRAYEIVVRCLQGMVCHPNVSAAVIVGLGCEVVQAAVVASAAQSARVPHQVVLIQEAGGTGPAIRRGTEALVPLLRHANQCRRSDVPLAELVVGTECGGSDAYSGITANPVLGLAGDLLIQAGSSWVLAETPEIYGAEHLLLNRAETTDVEEKLESVLRWWEEHAAAHGASLDNNPAPGNKEGGITTIYEKALGAVAKGGSSPLRDVLQYAEQVRRPGLSFMDTPGFDNVSITGLVAGGCNLLAFTTGRGSCLAFPGVPVVKIASTSELYHRMSGDMDFDAGVVLAGTTVAEAAASLARQLVEVASGKRTCGEAQGLGQTTFTPWNLGPTL